MRNIGCRGVAIDVWLYGSLTQSTDSRHYTTIPVSNNADRTSGDTCTHRCQYPNQRNARERSVLAQQSKIGKFRFRGTRGIRRMTCLSSRSECMPKPLRSCSCYCCCCSPLAHVVVVVVVLVVLVVVVAVLLRFSLFVGVGVVSLFRLCCSESYLHAPAIATLAPTAHCWRL
jgi:hypothetical protein